MHVDVYKYVVYVITAREEAVALGNELLKRHFFNHVTFDHEFKDEHLFYRLLSDGYARALNAQLSYACIPRPGIVTESGLCSV